MTPTSSTFALGQKIMPDSIQPAKVYSPAELEECRNRFRPLAHAYIRRQRICQRLFFITVGSVIAGTALHAFGHLSLTWARTPFFVFGGVWFILLVTGPRLICPACSHRMQGNFGMYCPLCGCKALSTKGVMWTPKCTACGEEMHKGKGRLFDVRACSGCGLNLGVDGL